MSMKAKLYVCDSGDSFRTAHNMYINKSYAECTIFDLIVEDVEVENGSSCFNNLVLCIAMGMSYIAVRMGNFIPKNHVHFVAGKTFF